MKERLLVFHGTSSETMEKIVGSGAIKTSGGIYGTGVYCTNSFKKAYEHSYGAIIGIYPKGLEKHARIPMNKFKKWIIFDDEIPLKNIKYLIDFTNKSHNCELERFSGEISKERDFVYIHYPLENMDFFKAEETLNLITNFLYSHASKSLPYPVQWDKIKVCKEYSIDCVIGTIKSVLDSKNN